MKIDHDVSASDALFFAGLLLLVVGLALWSAPLALVVLGVLLLAAGVLMHLAGQRAEAGDKARAAVRSGTGVGIVASA